MAEWIVGRRAQLRRLAHGHQPVRPRSGAPPASRWPAIVESYQRYYDIPYPGLQRDCRPTAAHQPGLRLASRARRRVRREGRLGAGRLLPAQRAARRRVAAPARLGRALLVAGDRRRAPRNPQQPPGCSTRRPSPSSKSAARMRRDLLEWVCDNRVARGDRRRHLHAGAEPARRHRGRLHRHPHRRRRLPHRHRDGVRHARRRLAAQAGPPPRRRRAHRRRHRASTPATRSGDRGRATSSPRSPRPTSRTPPSRS